MPWTRITSLAGSTFEGSTAEQFFVRVSSLLLTLREANNDGYHHLVNVSPTRAFPNDIELGYVSNGQMGIPANRLIGVGTICAWSVNGTDESADPTDLTPAGRGRDVQRGTVLAVSSDRRVLSLGDISGNPIAQDRLPSTGDVIYFNFPQ